MIKECSIGLRYQHASSEVQGLEFAVFVRPLTCVLWPYDDGKHSVYFDDAFVVEYLCQLSLI